MICFEYFGIVVKNLEESNEFFEKILGCLFYKVEEVEFEYVKIVFFKIGEFKIELLEVMVLESVIVKYVEKWGEGIYYIVFEVEDIYVEMECLKVEGFCLFNEEFKWGVDNKFVCFVYLKSVNGVLLEFCQEIKE